MTEDKPTSENPDVDTQRQAEIDALAAQLASAAAGEPEAAAPRKRASRRVTAKNPTEFTPTESEEAPAAPAAEEAPKRRRSAAAEAKAAAAKAEEEQAASDEVAEASAEASDGGDPAADAPSDAAEPADADADAESTERESSESDVAEGESGEGEQRSGRSRRGRSRNRSGADGNQNGQNGQNGQGAQQSQQGNRRGRGRGPVGDDVEPEILEDDVLIPVAGILDVLDNYAFVRTTGYLPGPTDVYVSLGQVKKYGLRKGDAVVGAIRQPRDGEQPGRQKYNALVKVDSVNGQTAEQSIARVEFAAATPVRATTSLGLSGAVSGLGKGARALVIGETGKTALVAQIAEQVSANQPESHLMVILVSPRPEEITDFRRSVKGEVVVAGLEQTAEDHVTVIDLAVERAKRLVELGIDVTVLIDSITGLGRAHYTLASRPSIEDPAIALPAKRLFAAARAVEEGASLTIIATASEGAAIDRLVASELRGTANAVVQLP
ncbi:MAG TPA: transcription termination factor Rho [Microbacteriaceae bacterium]|nr:transcription termination factor Rho [Microbacteriaceae bacterium]